MSRIFGEPEAGRIKAKECLPGQVFAEHLGRVRYDLGGCNSAVECLLPKQDVAGSNPVTRSSLTR